MIFFSARITASSLRKVFECVEFFSLTLDLQTNSTLIEQYRDVYLFYFQTKGPISFLRGFDRIRDSLSLFLSFSERISIPIVGKNDHRERYSRSMQNTTSRMIARKKCAEIGSRCAKRCAVSPDDRCVFARADQYRPSMPFHSPTDKSHSLSSRR